MKKRLIAILLVSLSFWMLHPFVIEALDTHRCSVHKFVKEVESISLEQSSGDICDIHAAFHIVFLMPQIIMIKSSPFQKQLPNNVKNPFSSDFIFPFFEPPKNV